MIRIDQHAVHRVVVAAGDARRGGRIDPAAVGVAKEEEIGARPAEEGVDETVLVDVAEGREVHVARGGERVVIRRAVAGLGAEEDRIGGLPAADARYEEIQTPIAIEVRDRHGHVGVGVPILDRDGLGLGPRRAVGEGAISVVRGSGSAKAFGPSRP